MEMFIIVFNKTGQNLLIVIATSLTQLYSSKANVRLANNGCPGLRFKINHSNFNDFQLPPTSKEIKTEMLIIVFNKTGQNLLIIIVTSLTILCFSKTNIRFVN
jgi:hypothetical protein